MGRDHLVDGSHEEIERDNRLFAGIEDELANEDLRGPTRKEITEEDEFLLRRQAEFRLGADAVAGAFAKFPEVSAIALFGSVAAPLKREVPRFRQYRRARVELWHECKDVDLAVWIDRVDNLDALAKAERQAVRRFHEETGVGMAHHQVDTFLIEPGTNRYLGRLCWYNACPKGKDDCLAPGCGREKFLKQHVDFRLYPDALAEERLIRLYDRATGNLRKAPPIPGAKLLKRKA